MAVNGREDEAGGPVRALVLSGGGARGAYEVGVAQYIFGRLARELGARPHFHIHAGTSVGAVHSCYLAGFADAPEAGVDELVEIWGAMSFDRVYRFGVSDLIGFAGTALGSLLGRSTHADEHPERLAGLLNTEPLEDLVLDRIPWRRLRQNVRSGLVRALCVSTTEIATGRTVVFVDNREHEVPSWTRDPMQVARPARITAAHALASAAIPLLFPAVRVGDGYYADGSLRQHTPLTPALRLGANRLVIVGLRRDQGARVDDKIRRAREQKALSAGFLAGKVLDTLLIDPLEYDVAHMHVLNRMLRAGIDICGPEYLERVNPAITSERGLGFQVVDDAYVRPSEDIGSIAAHHVRRLLRTGTRSWLGSGALRALTRGEPEEEADLMSFLLFDRDYALELIELGRADARRNEEDLLRVLSS